MPWLNVMTLVQQCRNLLCGFMNLLGGDGRHINHINAADELRSQHAAFGSREGHEHHLVLILSSSGLPLGFKYAEDPEGDILDAHLGVNRILTRAEEMIHHRLS